MTTKNNVLTFTADEGTVTFEPITDAARVMHESVVGGGWLLGTAHLVEAIRDRLAHTETGEHEVRYGVWAQMPADRDTAEAVVVAILLGFPSAVVDEAAWDLLDTETVPGDAIR